MMMGDDDGGDGSWREGQFGTSEQDEGNEATSNRGYDSENGDLIEEENDDGSNHDSGRSSDQDGGDEKEEREDGEEGAPPNAEAEDRRW